MRLAALAALFVIAACAGGATSPPQSTNIAGNWALSVNLTSCVESGTIALEQSGANFSGSETGTESCTGGFTANVDGTITGGVVAGASVSFVGALPLDNAGCVYQGTASGSRVTLMSGSVTCFDSSANATATGAWKASR